MKKTIDVAGAVRRRRLLWWSARLATALVIILMLADLAVGTLGALAGARVALPLVVHLAFVIAMITVAAYAFRSLHARMFIALIGIYYLDIIAYSALAGGNDFEPAQTPLFKLYALDQIFALGTFCKLGVVASDLPCSSLPALGMVAVIHTPLILMLIALGMRKDPTLRTLLAEDRGAPLAGSLKHRFLRFKLYAFDPLGLILLALAGLWFWFILQQADKAVEIFELTGISLNGRALEQALLPLLFITIGALPAVWLFRTGIRRLRVDANSALRIDRRSPTLLLRSFADDNRSIWPSGLVRMVQLRRMRLEEAISITLAQRGPFIGIGAPGEELPQLGAHRAYFADDEWQQAIRDWLERSDLVILVAGLTPWVQWELRTILGENRVGKLIVVLPPDAPGGIEARHRLVADCFADTPWAAHLKDAGFERTLAILLAPGGNVTLIESAKRTEADYDFGLKAALLVQASTARTAPAR